MVSARTIVSLLLVSATTALQPAMRPGPGLTPGFSQYKLTKEDTFEKTRVILADMQVSALAAADNVSSYFYLHGANGPLTLIFTPCNSVINVTVYHIPQNNTGFLRDYYQGRPDFSLAMSRGMEPHLFTWSERPAGLYRLDLVAEHRATLVMVYATNMPVPAALSIEQHPRIRIQPRLHRHRVTVRWDQSVVDPQMMNYYVVVNSRRNFTTLCEAYAQSAFGMHVYSMTAKTHRMNSQFSTKSSSETVNPQSDFKMADRQLGIDHIFVVNVGSSLSYTISSLQRGRTYYFNIFAENRQTQLSFLYGSKELKYDTKLHPFGLRDNKAVTVNIRRLGGRALFRFKVSAVHNYASTLNWHVMPCGGTIQAEVKLRREVIIPQQTIQGYKQLQILSPRLGTRYALLVTVPDAYQMRQLLGVEVLATMKTSVLPQLPAEAKIHEYLSMRTCNSITVGWVPTVTEGSVKYCVSASLVPVTEPESNFKPRPNQCDLDSRLSNQLDFAVKHCQDFSSNDNRNVLTQTISKLRSGKEYVIQVTAKKMKGKALSYDLLRVQTKTKCKVVYP